MSSVSQRRHFKILRTGCDNFKIVFIFLILCNLPTSDPHSYSVSMIKPLVYYQQFIFLKTNQNPPESTLIQSKAMAYIHSYYKMYKYHSIKT